MAGDWQLVFNEGDPSLGTFGNLYRVCFVSPPLLVFHAPSATPFAVKRAIESASQILWLSPSASANRLRQAVDVLLTAKKVRRTAVTTKGKRTKFTLHQRIEVFRSTHPDVAEALEAVKWIGNDGSHDTRLTVADVLTGSEILELAVRSLYDESDALLKAKVNTINRSKGLP